MNFIVSDVIKFFLIKVIYRKVFKEIMLFGKVVIDFNYY